jgi:hypothetical protein
MMRMAGMSTTGTGTYERMGDHPSRPIDTYPRIEGMMGLVEEHSKFSGTIVATHPTLPE